MVEKYLSEKSLECFSMVKPSENRKTLALVSKNLFDLVMQFKASPEVAEMHSSKQLGRVLNEQCHNRLQMVLIQSDWIKIRPILLSKSVFYQFGSD